MARFTVLLVVSVFVMTFMKFVNTGFADNDHGIGIGKGLGIGKGNGKGNWNKNGHGKGKGVKKGEIVDNDKKRPGGNKPPKRGLSVNFYKNSCPEAEIIIKQVVARHFQSDKSVPAALLRMHFHDCFVTGCDASLLLDSTPSNKAEKEALPNLTVRGYEIIDEAKALLEKACPSTVSCADIVTLATRDSVALAGGPAYELPTGRKDGRDSFADQVDLPSPRITIRDATTQFGSKGLTREDMIFLLGAHTTGVSHCLFFSDRIYNFGGSGAPDPSMNATLVEELKKVCPRPPTSPPNLASIQADKRVFLDQGTPFPIDNSFYKQVMMNKGILQIDQKLGSDRATQPLVKFLATNDNAFLVGFAKAMVKMGSIEVLTDSSGEIRKNCRVQN